jgi:phosphotransferase system enzyme I (PtsI)
VQRLSGIGVSPGLVIGPSVVMQHPLALRFSITPERVGGEVARLEEARDRSRQQLRDIRHRVMRDAGAELGRLFEAQLLMLDDPMLVPRAATLIRTDRVNAEWAIQSAFDELSAVFDGVEDAYLRERKGDVADVVGRLSMNLERGRSRGRDLFNELEEPSVLITDELSPSTAGQLDWSKIRGFAIDAGSRTYHTAILARSLQLPAVVGLREASRRIEPGTLVIVDGTAGEVVIDPSPDVLADARRRGERAPVSPSVLPGRELPAVSLDGVPIRLEANVELADDIDVAREHGAQGIGLFRSEMLLGQQAANAVAEETQYLVYRNLVERMAPAPVTVRTFDTAAQQGSGATGSPLGLRAIRVSLACRSAFRTQLRALLRAAHHGSLRIMFPFVSSVEELREARAVLHEAEHELATGGVDAPAISVGVMIEVPSAALTADLLARDADFFSIGTNDLIQYALAVDRTDARVSSLYQPLHPGLLRLIRQVTRAAGARGIPVSLCGEMASDPALLPLLVGLGLKELSMTPSAIPMAKQVIRNLRVDRMARIAARALRLPTSAEIEAFLTRQALRR